MGKDEPSLERIRATLRALLADPDAGFLIADAAAGFCQLR
jgi:hypothetical protein